MAKSKEDFVCDVIKAYHGELMEDLHLDDLNVDEKSKLCSAIGAKWWMYCIQEKNLLEKLADHYNDSVEEFILKNQRAGSSRAKLEVQAKLLPHMKDMAKKITEQELIVEYLTGDRKNDGAVKRVTSLSYDIGHAIDILKMRP